MRAVSLSDSRVISLLNRYYVPVYVSNEDFREGGCAPPEERAELRRIHREGYAAKLSVGTVHAYVLDPAGKLIDSLHVTDAFKPDRLAVMLERAAAKLATRPGEAIVKASPPLAPTPAPGSLLLHLTARYLERKGSELVLVENAGGNWSALPGEDWISLDRARWTRLLPTGDVRPGQLWELDAAAASEILTHFYPPTENNDAATNRIDAQSLRATVLSVKDGVARAGLEGRLRMKHPFYQKDDGKYLEAALVGYLDFEPAVRRVRSLRLVTDQALYGEAGNQQPFGVALETVSGARPTSR